MHCLFSCLLILKEYTLIPVHPYTLIEYGFCFSNLDICWSVVGNLIPSQFNLAAFSLSLLVKRSGCTFTLYIAEVTAHLKHSLSSFFTLNDCLLERQLLRQWKIRTSSHRVKWVNVNVKGFDIFNLPSRPLFLKLFHLF